MDDLCQSIAIFISFFSRLEPAEVVEEFDDSESEEIQPSPPADPEATLIWFSDKYIRPRIEGEKLCKLRDGDDFFKFFEVRWKNWKSGYFYRENSYRERRLRRNSHVQVHVLIQNL